MFGVFHAPALSKFYKNCPVINIFNLHIHLLWHAITIIYTWSYIKSMLDTINDLVPLCNIRVDCHAHNTCKWEMVRKLSWRPVASQSFRACATHNAKPRSSLYSHMWAAHKHIMSTQHHTYASHIHHTLSSLTLRTHRSSHTPFELYGQDAALSAWYKFEAQGPLNSFTSW